MSGPKYHVAIVGAGLGGLAAAIGIARAGHRVTILEQASELGEVSYCRRETMILLMRVLTARIYIDWRRYSNTTELFAYPQTLEHPGQDRIRLGTPRGHHPALLPRWLDPS